ncbi:Minor extracellular serine protease [Kibdelosporangium sp. 4NS15]|uniref:Minor extracellular serine protease n=2 Tax=Kibdelosporangium persicum TaxID=2698649 RepID=A0ABX2FAD1_9PSEU|nr:S8 family serine peptidase [Kibdelosporangium persicum]NRN68277.1 Minor extracellular serine protease [Kibdelosporangium persicum]
MIAMVMFALVASVTSAGTAISEPRDFPLAMSVPVRQLPESVTDEVAAPLLDDEGPVTAFVALDRRPAVDVYNELSNRAGANREEAAQAARDAAEDTTRTADVLAETLRARDATAEFLYTTVNAVAGMVVNADASAIRDLAARPEVQSVRRVVPKSRTNSSAVQVTKTLNAWQNTGKLGDGIRIGIIDDGVDYTHATFGGPGTPEAYTAIDRTTVDPSFFPTAKVVGGADLAGDQYDSSGRHGSKTPTPDPNPIACGQHGTHVAGTAAGFGVNADGTTFRGDYTKLTPQQADDMLIGPGTAPKAVVYAIKIFGCKGSTDLTAQALDRALDPNGDGDFTDRLDLVNMSLGSDFGAPDDPDSLFVRKLARNNVLSVVAGGNGGDVYDIGGAPGNTPEALTVASTRDPYVLRDAVEVTAPADVAGQAGGQYGLAYTGFDQLDLTKPVAAVSDSSNADGCDPFSEQDKAAVAGKFVWLEWDDSDARRCGSAPRAANAKDAGAAGVLLPSGTDVFQAAIAGLDSLPMFQFTATATEPLRPALRAGTLSVRMLGSKRASLKTKLPRINDTPSDFTSRGVRSPVVKPDVAAPGDTIASALTGSGNRTLMISGTSMAAPHVAGIAALVRQTRPDWTPEEIKAAVMNTAGDDVRTEPGGTVLAPQRVGVGRVNAQSAVDNQVLAMVVEAQGAVSVSFGTVEAVTRTSVSRTVKLVNKSDAPAEFDVAYQEATKVPGVRYDLSRGAVRVPARGAEVVRVTLRIDDPLALRKTIDPTVAPLQSKLARQFVADASGRLVLTPKSGSALRVPVYAAPRPVAKLSTEPQVKFDTGNQGILPLHGKGLDQGEGREAYRSLISVLQLQSSSPQLPSCRRNRTTGCTVNDTAKGGDIRYVGVASTAPHAVAQGEPEKAVVAFGIATWGNWYNLGSNTVPVVGIDTDGDTKPDFEASVRKLTRTDVWVVNTVDLTKPNKPSVARMPLNGQLGDVDTGVFDTNVAVLPVPLKALGIDPAKESARFSYTVGVAGFYSAPGDGTSLIDSVGSMTFDPLNPDVRVTGQGEDALVFFAKPGTALSVIRDKAVHATERTTGLLVLNHHNATGDRAAVVRIPAR